MKGKRIAACLLAAVTAIVSFSGRVQALSDSELPAPSAVLMEASTGKVLYEKNAHEQRPCASITKVMTLLLVMEGLDSGQIHLEDMVTASEHAASMGGSDIWLEPGETMSVDDLLKATVIVSANDAAVALAEHLCGSEEAFVQRMNERAAELGMTKTVFKNCNGLDEDGHVTTAYDIALMSRALIAHEKIFDYTQVWMDELRGGKTQLVNTNKLLKTYSGITGLKTGTTGKAGSCMTATAERDGMSLIAVVLGCDTTDNRFSAASALLDYGFAGWTLTVPSLPPVALDPIEVECGMNNSVDVSAETIPGVVVPKGREGDVVCEAVLETLLTAPVEQGQTVGKITCALDGETLAEIPVCAASAVEELTLSSALQYLLRAAVCF